MISARFHVNDLDEVMKFDKPHHLCHDRASTKAGHRAPVYLCAGGHREHNFDPPPDWAIELMLARHAPLPHSAKISFNVALPSKMRQFILV